MPAVPTSVTSSPTTIPETTVPQEPADWSTMNPIARHRLAVSLVGATNFAYANGPPATELVCGMDWCLPYYETVRQTDMIATVDALGTPAGARYGGGGTRVTPPFGYVGFTIVSWMLTPQTPTQDAYLDLVVRLDAQQETTYDEAVGGPVIGYWTREDQYTQITPGQTDVHAVFGPGHPAYLRQVFRANTLADHIDHDLAKMTVQFGGRWTPENVLKHHQADVQFPGENGDPPPATTTTLSPSQMTDCPTETQMRDAVAQAPNIPQLGFDYTLEMPHCADLWAFTHWHRAAGADSGQFLFQRDDRGLWRLKGRSGTDGDLCEFINVPAALWARLECPSA